MFGTFRQAMTWVHTWFGLVLGYVLMVVFFFGTLSVFSSEIDHWGIPEARFVSSGLPSFDAVLKPVLERLQPSEKDLAEARERSGAPLVLPLRPLYWSVDWSPRSPMPGFYAEFAVPNPTNPRDYVYAGTVLDPRTGKRFEQPLALGGDFFYPLHYTLGFHWQDLGMWIVGVAALMMLVALVTGVVIHKKIFRELVTFRPEKKGQRRVLDLHNLTGVVALPFHFIFAFTGLVIFAGIYFPVTEKMFQRLHDQHEASESLATGLPKERAGVAAGLASVDAMVEESARRWAKLGLPGQVGSIQVHHVGDKNGYVSISPTRSDRLAAKDPTLHFEASTGRPLPGGRASSAVARVSEYLTGIHLMPFHNWLLRWLLFFGGLMSCACIATGFVFFVGKRRRKHVSQGARGARWVDALAVSTVTGMLVATLAILVANRALPAGLADRNDWQKRTFWISWLLTLVHAALRAGPVRQGRLAPAWREQCYAVAALSGCAVVLNWITTGDHLVSTIGRGYWPVAGIDLVLLAAAALAAFAAVRLRRSENAAPDPSDESSADEPSTGAPPPDEVAHA